MNEQNLYQTLAVQTTSYDETRMRKHIKRFVKGISGAKLHYNERNIYVTKGKADIYPCVVAHMDTVHEIHKGFKIFETDGNLFAFNPHNMEQVGIGGDDKVGVFIALEMLREFDNIKIVFFSQEEIGCVGSSRAKMDFFNDCAFVLQCDRKGNEDFVSHSWEDDLYGPEFKKLVDPILKDWLYADSDGGLTDVIQLKGDGLEIACANMSCGYYEPHSDQEYVNIEDVESCWGLVHDIITKLGSEQHYHKGFERYRHGYGGHGRGYDECYGYGHNFTPKYRKIEDDEQAFIAYETPVGYCNHCGSSIVRDEFHQALCMKCSHYPDSEEWTSYKEYEDAVEERMLDEDNMIAAEILENEMYNEDEDRTHDLLPVHDLRLNTNHFLKAYRCWKWLSSTDQQTICRHKEGDPIVGELALLFDKIDSIDKICNVEKVLNKAL